MINRIIIVLGFLVGSVLAAWGASTLSGLSAGTSISGTDLFYDVQTPGVGGVKVTGTQFLNFVFGNVSGSCTASGSGVFTCSGSGGGSTSIAAGTNITTSGTATNTIVNVVATPTFTSITTTLASVTGWLTTSGHSMQTATIVGNLTSSTAQFTGALTGTTAVFQTATIPRFTGTPPSGGATFQFDMPEDSGNSASRTYFNDTTNGSDNVGFSWLIAGSKKWTAAAVLNGGTKLDFQFYNEQLNANGFYINGDTNALIVQNPYVLGWPGSGNRTPDTALSRDAANVLDIGNGTAQDASGTIRLAAINSATQTLAILASGTRAQTVSSTATTFAAALNAPAIAQLGANTTGYACWTTGTGAISEDSTTCIASLRRLKKDIVPFTDATAELMALKPSQFQWKNPVDTNQRGQQLGFIAEDVHDVDTRLSSYTGDGSLHGWRQDAMIAALVRGFQEQQAIIQRQQAEIDELKQGKFP